MSSKQLLLSSVAVAIPALATAHDMTIAKIDGFNVKTDGDIVVIRRDLPYIAGAFVPKEHRITVIEALNRLSTRVAQAGLAESEVTVGEIAKAVTTISDQPDKMAKTAVQNGHGTDVGDATQAATATGERHAQS
jgi:hypothetical protein